MKVLTFDPLIGSMQIKDLKGLKEMQAVVGGLIESTSIYDENIDIVVNEEGLMHDFTISVVDQNKKPLLVGPLFFARVDHMKGEYVDLTDEDIRKIKSLKKLSLINLEKGAFTHVIQITVDY